jgi:hypothetical protein
MKYQNDNNDKRMRKRSRSLTNAEDKLAIESYLNEVTN